MHPKLRSYLTTCIFWSRDQWLSVVMWLPRDSTY